MFRKRMLLSLVLNRNISSLLLSLCIVFILGSVGSLMYESNDDMGIISILAGGYNGISVMDGYFLSSLLSYLLHYLYSMFNYIPWYSLFLYCMQFTALFLMVKTVRVSIPRWNIQLICILALSMFYIYMLYRLNFASVSLFLWFAVTIYIANLNIKQINPTYSEIVLGLLLGISYLVRPSIFYISLLFSVPVVLSFFFFKNKKRIALLVIPLVFIILLSFISDIFIRSNDQYKSFVEFNKIRSTLMDTNIGKENEQTSKALKIVGWTEEDYKMATNWWLYNEEKFDKSRLVTFLDNNKSHLSLFSLDSGIQNILNLKIYFITIIICLFFIISGSKETINVGQTNKSLSIQNIVGAACLYILLGIIALSMVRFPNRISIPLLIYLLGAIVVTYPFFGFKSINFLKYKSLMAIAMTSLLVFITYNYSHLQTEAELRNTFKDYTENSITKVMKQNGEDTFFINFASITITESVNPLKEFKDLVNYQLFPGGWLIRSPYYYELLKDNGLMADNKLNTKAIINNDRFVIATWVWNGNDEIINVFEKYLNDTYGYYFPNKTVNLDLFIDDRYRSNFEKSGWVYYKIKTS